MAELFHSEDVNTWRKAYGYYTAVLKALSKEKKKLDLSELDDWFQKSLPLTIKSKREPLLTKEELVKLMQWKLTRGKFRPRLTELVQQNSSEEVESITKSAIAALPNLENAVKILTKLKAVGPATASAILCAAAPHIAPFMADEAVLAVPGMGKLDYTLKQYLKYAQIMKSKADQLSELQGPSSEESWTPHKVEMSLWTYYHANKLKLLTNLSGTSYSDNTDEPAPPPTKRVRHTSP